FAVFKKCLKIPVFYPLFVVDFGSYLTIGKKRNDIIGEAPPFIKGFRFNCPALIILNKLTLQNPMLISGSFHKLPILIITAPGAVWEVIDRSGMCFHFPVFVIGFDFPLTLAFLISCFSGHFTIRLLRNGRA